MILAFSLFILFASKSHKKSFIFSIFILIILIYSYINACFNFHNYIYPLKPLFRYLTYLMVLSISYIYLKENKVFRLFSILVFIEILLALYQILAFGIDRPRGTLQNNNTLMYLIVLLFSLNIAWKNNFIVCFFSMYICHTRWSWRLYLYNDLSCFLYNIFCRYKIQKKNINSATFGFNNWSFF